MATVKTIQTLVTDIYDTVKSSDKWFTDELSRSFSDTVALRLREQLNADVRTPTLRLSKMGQTCPCALWHSIHKPELAEPLPPWATIKYSYGHILEALVLTLAKAAGHSVVGEQDAVEVDSIVGHRDAVVDGCIVDVKSTSSFSFHKFKDGSIKQDDLFGYLDQLDGYLVGSAGDPLVTVKDRGYIVAIDKQLGKLAIYEHFIREGQIRQRIEHYKGIVGRDSPPQCTCGTTAHGTSGNIKLDTRASYDAFKFACHPRLRTFLYANGPVYLTHVARPPEVMELDKHGNVVHAYV